MFAFLNKSLARFNARTACHNICNLHISSISSFRGFKNSVAGFSADKPEITLIKMIFGSSEALNLDFCLSFSLIFHFFIKMNGFPPEGTAMNNNIIYGLTSNEVEQRRKQGKVNTVRKVTTKSYKHIFFENICSVFNAMNVAIMLILLYVGSVKNCMYMCVVVCNTVIGIVQEIRSKRAVDRLSIINRSSVVAVRDGLKKIIDIEEIVKDDVIILSNGSQVPNDCTIIKGMCEVNESLVTGESDSIAKEEGTRLLSGSYLVSGECWCRVDNVGKDNYADSILGQIKYVKKTNSEIVKVIKRITVVMGICIVPFGGLLFYNQYNLPSNTFEDAVVNSAASIIGMIPEGLVLLISTVFTLGVLRLSQKNILSQNMYSLENLARTDVICLDKTGTITTGNMTVEKIVPAVGFSKDELQNALNVISAVSNDRNSTISAVRAASTEKPECSVVSTVPFSSDRKWSAVTTKEYGTFIMGAAEMIFKGKACDFSALDDIDRSDYRIVTVAASEHTADGRSLPDGIRLLGFVLMTEEIRSGAKDTFRYFQQEGVDIKIISGDNPETVSRLCSRAMGGKRLPCVDMSQVSDDEIGAAVRKNAIFGRVTPQQKKLIVSALKSQGHTVSMVGDGVNDVLALKESDCSIAPANGSEAARNVSHLILLDSDFHSLPDVVAEGRSSVNNLQNSASLFLTKTFFSAAMTLIFMFINLSYPFEPIHMTLISAMTIGMPSFILSLQKNNKRLKGKFILNVMRGLIPAAVTNIFAVMAVVVFSEIFDIYDEHISTLGVLVLAVTGVLLILRIYKPRTKLCIAVVCTSIAGLILSFTFLENLFNLYTEVRLLPAYILVAAGTTAMFELLEWLVSRATEGRGPIRAQLVLVRRRVRRFFNRVRRKLSGADTSRR